MEIRALPVLFFLLALNFGQSLHAEDKCPLPHEIIETPMLDRLKRTVDLAALKAVKKDDRKWFAASEEQVKNAPCRLPVPSVASINGHFAGMEVQAPKVSVNIRGINLQNQPRELVEALTKLITKSEHSTGRAMVDASEYSRDNQLAADVRRCRTVVCVVKKQWGEAVGPKMLYLLQKYGFNSSEISSIHQDTLVPTEGQLSSFIQGVQDYPAGMFPLKQNQDMKIIRARPLRKDGVIVTRNGRTVYDNDGTMANAVMTYYDPSWTQDKEGMRAYTVTHELGHNLGSEFDFDGSSWDALSGGWRAITKMVKNSDGSTTPETTYVPASDHAEAFVSNYATTNAKEDFAESVAAYRYNPNVLKLASPQKYDFLKYRVFNGLEYTDASSCQRQKSVNYALEQKANSELPSLNVQTFLSDEQNIKNTLYTCQEEMTEYVDAYAESNHRLDRCIKNGLIKAQMIKQVDALTAPSTQA